MEAAAQDTALPLFRRIPFSIPSFVHAMGGGLVVITLMIAWMALRADDTQERQQAKMPSKTAVIERIAAAAAPADEKAAPEPEQKTETENPAALPKAPIEGLYETTPAGQVPIANLATGQTPFEVYKRPTAPVAGRPGIAIVFIGAGLSASLTQGIIDDLPEDVSIAVSPYAAAPGLWMEKARAAGHEVWLTLPLQNETYPDPDPGPNTILSSVSLEQNQDRLMKVLASGTGYAGLISMDDHNFTESNTDIVPVLQQIFGRGLAFIDGRPDRPFFGATIAKAESYPYTDTDMTIGEDLTPETVKMKLADIERLALSQGGALVYAAPTPANILTVAEWAPTLSARGLQLLPASAMIRQ